MTDDHLIHNDVVLGFPCALAAPAAVVVDALHQLVAEGACGKSTEKLYNIKVFPDTELTDRLTLPPYVPQGLRGCFEVFTQDGLPIYIIWRVNHRDVDALSVLSFWEELHSTVTCTARRWSTPRQLLNSDIASFQHEDWIDTDGEPLSLPFRGRTPAEVGSRVAAAFAVAFARRTGRSRISIGFIKSGRDRDARIAPQNTLALSRTQCEIDVAEASAKPSAVFSVVHEELKKTVRNSPLSDIGIAESVDILVNVQTLNWYGTACSILGDSTPKFDHPIVYHQVNKLASQIRADIELWNPLSARLRIRNSSQISAISTETVPDGIQILHGEAQPLPICQGAVCRFDSLYDYLKEYIRHLDSQTIERINSYRRKIQAIDKRYAIGIIKESGTDTFLQVLACILSRRVCHFLGDETSNASDCNKAANRLAVPVAIPFSGRVRHIVPENTNRSVANDAEEGWAYIVSSGSTGKAKITLLSFAMSENIIGNAHRHLRLGPESRIAMAASPMFDAIYFECLLSLATSRLPYTPPPISTVISSHGSIGVDHGCTHLVATPTVLSLLVAKGISVPEIVMSVGEALPKDLLLFLKRSHKHVLDLYGPSEAGIWSGIRDASKGEKGFRPIDNVYFRPGASFDGDRFNVQIGFSSNVYGSSAFEVPSGDSAEFCSRSNVISNISRSDGLLKIGGQRFPINEVNEILLNKADFLPIAISETKVDSGQSFAAVMLVKSREEESVEVTSVLGARFILYRVTAPPTTKSGKLDVSKLLLRDGLEMLSTPATNGPVGISEHIARIWENYTGTRDATVAFSDAGGCSLDALRIQIDLEREGILAPLPSSTTTLQCLIRSATRSARPAE